MDSSPSVEPADMGFSDDTLKSLFDSVTGPKADVDSAGSGEGAIPDPPAAPVTKLGDVWLLGRHRLLCGDSRQSADVAKLQVKAVQGVITDPPYGIDYQGAPGHVSTQYDPSDPGKAYFRHTDKRDAIHNDTPDDLENLLRDAFGNALKLCDPGGAWYVTGPGDGPMIHFVTVLIELGIFRQSLVWVKDSWSFGRRDETIFYGWAPGGPHRKIRARDRSTVWTYDRPKKSKQHPTMKPVPLFAAAINDTMAQDATIYDPFLGSGTTLIACEEMGRTCVGVEIEPKYCDVIVERWENLTGDKAQRVSI